MLRADVSERCAARLIVLHCIPSLSGGGAERQLVYLSTELAKNGGDVHIAHLIPPADREWIQSSAATLHPLRGNHNHDPRLLWQLLRIVRQVKPDLIQTWLPQMDVLGGLAAILSRTPFLITERS